MISKYTNLGFEVNKHWEPNFFLTFIYGVEVPVSVLVAAVYKTIEDFNYGIVVKYELTYFLKLTKKIASADIILIRNEVKNRVKEYEQEYYMLYRFRFELVDKELQSQNETLIASLRGN